MNPRSGFASVTLRNLGLSFWVYVTCPEYAQTQGHKAVIHTKQELLTLLFTYSVVVGNIFFTSMLLHSDISM